MYEWYNLLQLHNPLLNWLLADRIYIRKYFITSPLSKSKEKSTRYENLFILHDLIEFYKPHNT